MLSQLFINNFLMRVKEVVLFLKNYVFDISVNERIIYFSILVGENLIYLIKHAIKGLSHIFAISIADNHKNHSTLPIITFKI